MRGFSLDVALKFDPQATRQERGLLRALAYDSIRWYLRLDALLDRLLARPGQKLEPEVRALAIVGLCQLLYTQIPPHAAVAETVEAARQLGHPRAAGFINAVLRRCQREHAQLLAQVDRDVALRTAHPRWLVDALGRTGANRRQRFSLPTMNGRRSGCASIGAALAVRSIGRASRQAASL